MTYEEKIGKQKFAALVADFFANRYIDRGMRKWQGYYLSDHTSALKKQAQTEHLTYPPLSLQDQAYIRMILLRAYAEGQSVTIQLDLQTPDGQMLPPITGKVGGVTDSDVVHVGDQNISIRMIRHIDLIPFPV
ncbi:phage infection protein [Lacticaseibacillus rhamnosus]|uniref:phage infection protein n=1 Tax=Lacticaseibacillus rhamnosus TaxID=47715 RepID=UPI001013C62C|nr:phage infection protein [Lacticaseibacillus rhamnosus]RXS53784.1 phage infection protein [Lacticaseibacillus rhamnosus]